MARRNCKNLALVCILVFSAWLVSCGKEYDGSMGTPYAAYVVSLENVTAEGTPKYGIVKKEFKFLTDFNGLKGDFVDFKRGGKLKIKEVKGSIVSAESF